MDGWKIRCEWRFLARKITVFYGPLSRKPCDWWPEGTKRTRFHRPRRVVSTRTGAVSPRAGTWASAALAAAQRAGDMKNQPLWKRSSRRLETEGVIVIVVLLHIHHIILYIIQLINGLRYCCDLDVLFCGCHPVEPKQSGLQANPADQCHEASIFV